MLEHGYDQAEAVRDLLLTVALKRSTAAPTWAVINASAWGACHAE
jgi:hypothetical protein